MLIRMQALAVADGGVRHSQPQLEQICMIVATVVEEREEESVSYRHLCPHFVFAKGKHGGHSSPDIR